MHKFEMPEWAVRHVEARRGRVHPFDEIEAARTCLVVVDLQNGFMLEGVAHTLVPIAHKIVPNVNRLAAALRDAGGTVVWIKNTVTEESLTEWSVHNYDLSHPARREKRRESMRRGSEGHELWAGLDVSPEDLVVEKQRYSAFIQGSSNLESLLRERGIDTVIVAGVATDVCCESTARDAMMLNFRTIMVSDATGTRSDESHGAALTAFYISFGDVMSTDELISRL